MLIKKQILSKFKNNKLPIILIIIVSILARFWYFWQPSFSGDEAAHMGKAISVARGIFGIATINNIESSLKNIFFTILEHNHAPLEFLILLPAAVTNSREFFARLIYIIVNLLTIFIVYKFAIKIKNFIFALTILVLLGTSLYVVWWSQTAMYLSLSINASLFIGIFLINFVQIPSQRNLVYVAISFAIGLLVFPDFIFFAPAIIWAVADARKKITMKGLIFPICIGLVPIILFYIPWMLYALTGNALHGGFNYITKDKLQGNADIINNLKTYWETFFTYPGIITVWPLGLLTILKIRKTPFVKYFFLIIITYFLIFVLKARVPFFYIIPTFSLFCILTAEWVSNAKGIWRVTLGIIIFVNLITLTPVFKGVHNPFMFGNPNELDHVKQVGQIAKVCLSGPQETYISSFDSWKTNYYFGKRSLLEREDRISAIVTFLEGKADEVELIHYKSGELDTISEERLIKKATRVVNLDQEKVFLFKECTTI